MLKLLLKYIKKLIKIKILYVKVNIGINFIEVCRVPLLHVYSSKVGPLEPSCSLKDQLCFTLLEEL